MVWRVDIQGVGFELGSLVSRMHGRSPFIGQGQALAKEIGLWLETLGPLWCIARVRDYTREHCGEQRERKTKTKAVDKASLIPSFLCQRKATIMKIRCSRKGDSAKIAMQVPKIT